MHTAAGISLLNKIAVGKIRIYRRPQTIVSDAPAKDTASELEKFESARERAAEQQNKLCEKALAESGREAAEIIKAHVMMLEDAALNDAVREMIVTRKHNAVYAVKTVCDNQAKVFERMEDPYFRARAADVDDIAQSVLDIMTGSDTAALQGTEPSILAAEDLTPSETVKLDKSLLLGFITRGGSTNSHTAVLARSMNIPALVQCADLSDEWDGMNAAVDGYHSCIYVDPEPELLSALTARRDEELKRDALLQEMKNKDNTTIDGTAVRLYANISGPQDVGAVQENDAGGVGLFRTEFVYLGSKAAPSEEEQFLQYRQVLEMLAPREVVFRTCDLGADKTAGYMGLEHEENPALGYRAIRICLTRKAFFKTQLRALLRASVYGNMLIMFPMICSVRELREAKDVLEECRRELAGEGVPAGKYQVGTMIETPAAVLTADELAEESDFFSIGTNDLTQYTCAVDRGNAKLEPFLDPHHPAVLREIRMTVDAGHRHGIRVGICGELGADPSLTETFLRMGVDELSVNPESVLPLRKIIRSLNLKEV